MFQMMKRIIAMTLVMLMVFGVVPTPLTNGIAYAAGAAWTDVTNEANFVNPIGVGVSGNGDIYVMDGVFNNSVLYKYSGGAWSNISLPNNMTNAMGGIYVTSSGDVYAHLLSENFASTHIYKYSGGAWSDITYNRALPDPNPTDIVVDSAGNVYSINGQNAAGEAIMKLASGETTWVDYAPSVAFHYPVGMVFDSLGNAYVSSNNGSEILKRDSEGTWSTFNNTITAPAAMMMTSADHIYAADFFVGMPMEPGMIWEYDGASWSTFPTGDGNFSQPIDMALGNSGGLYVIDKQTKLLKRLGPGEQIVQTSIINALNLTTLVTAPTTGATPDTTEIDEEQYTGTITWKEADGLTDVVGTFDANSVYRAVITLTAKAGYTLTGVVQDSFTYTGATSVANSPDSGIVTIIFAATADEVSGGQATAESYFTFNSGTGTITGYDYVNGPVAVIIPSEISGVTVETIGNNAFSTMGQYYGLDSVVIPESVTSVGIQAFAGCKMTTVVIPSSVTQIGASAFMYVPLTSITIGSNVTFDNSAMGTQSGSFLTYYNSQSKQAGTYTYSNGNWRREVEITVVSTLDLTSLVTAPVAGATPDTTAIDEEQYTGTIIWKEADGLTDVVGAFATDSVYRSVVTLTAKAGYTLTGVAQDSFTYTGATSVANSADSGIVTITFSATEADSGNQATEESYFTFDASTGTITAYSNSGPKDVVIPSTIGGIPVVTIGNSAFQNKALTSVTIPLSVTTINASAFMQNQLTSLTIPNGVLTIGNSAFALNQLTTVELPDSLTAISDAAFQNNQLTSITFGSGLTSIGGGAFLMNLLTSVTIGSGVSLNNDWSMGNYGPAFKRDYEGNTNAAGTYTYNADTLNWLPSDVELSSNTDVATVGNHYLVDVNNGTIAANQTTITTEVIVADFLANLTKDANAEWKVAASDEEGFAYDDVNENFDDTNMQEGDLLFVKAEDGTEKMYRITVTQPAEAAMIELTHAELNMAFDQNENEYQVIADKGYHSYIINLNLAQGDTAVVKKGNDEVIPEADGSYVINLNPEEDYQVTGLATLN